MVELGINFPTWLSVALLFAGFICPVPVALITGITCAMRSQVVSIWKGLGFGLLVGLAGIGLNFLSMILGVGFGGIVPLAVVVASAAVTWWVCVGRYSFQSDDLAHESSRQETPAGS